MSTLKVMLIEDDEVPREELARLIEKEGFKVIKTGDGKEAAGIFKIDKPDIIISDINIPGINGMELMKEFKKSNSNLPVIFITGFSDADKALEAIRVGALDYIKKPIEIDNLLLALGRAQASVLEHANSKQYPVVVFADDEDLARINLSKVLRDENYHVIEAVNGKVALDIFKQNKVDIALLDIKMPVMDGLMALHEMRKVNDDFEAIIQTGFGDEAAAISALRDGAMNFIKKPVDIDELLVHLEKAKEKLTLRRAFKYRGRELELAKQIIAQISQFEEVSVSANDTTINCLVQQTIQLSDFISNGIVLLSQEMMILHANDFLKKSVQVPSILNEAFLDVIIKKFSYPISNLEVMTLIKECFNSPVGKLTPIIKNGKECLMFAKVNIKMQQLQKSFVLIVFKNNT